MLASHRPQLTQRLCLVVEFDEMRDDGPLETVSPSIRLTTLRLYELAAFLEATIDARRPVQAIGITVCFLNAQLCYYRRL